MATSEVQEHDYTRGYWGHAASWRATLDHTIHGHLFGKVREGDILILNTQRALGSRYRITKLDWKSDPGDMYFFDAEWVAPATGKDEQR